MRQRRAAHKANRWANDKATAIAEWAKESLRVPTGLLTGQPFTLAPFQIEWLRNALRASNKESALSCARKNGKSGLIAVVLLAFLVGPLNEDNWHSIVISLQGSLAAELRKNIILTAEASGLEDSVTEWKTPYPGHIIGSNGAQVTFLPATDASGHALSADLIIVDEAGLLSDKHRELWENCLSSVSGRNGKLWAISIKGDGPMFDELLKRRDSPGVFGVEYAAAEDCDIEDIEAWHSANPGLEAGIKSLDYMHHMSKRAAENPAYMPNFQSLDLNFPKDPERQMICSVPDWRKCLVETLPDRVGPCFVGIDLGSTTSMSGAAAYWPVTHRLEVWGAWPAEPNLEVRGRKDSKGNLYVLMKQRGELSTYPGTILSVPEFVRECKARLRGIRVTGAGADRHRYKELCAAFNVENIRWSMDWRNGQASSADNSADVRSFQAAIYGQLIAIERHLMLESAIKQSSITYDALGNPHLDKANVLSRIDALSAAVIAVGLGDRWRQQNRKPRKVYHGIVR